MSDSEPQVQHKRSTESISKVAPEADVKPVHAAGAIEGGDTRPPLDYSSVSAFTSSFRKRFASLWTRRFCLSLLAGQVSYVLYFYLVSRNSATSQVVSLCITCTNVTTTELVDRNWSLPTTQTWVL